MSIVYISIVCFLFFRLIPFLWGTCGSPLLHFGLRGQRLHRPISNPRAAGSEDCEVEGSTGAERKVEESRCDSVTAFRRRECISRFGLCFALGICTRDLLHILKRSDIGTHACDIALIQRNFIYTLCVCKIFNQ